METTSVQIVGRDSDGGINSVDMQTIDGKFFDVSGQLTGLKLTGLNIYQIMPKVKQLVMSGTSVSRANNMLGGTSANQLFYDASGGIARPPTRFFAYGTLLPPALPITLGYDYVDHTGAEKTASVLFTVSGRVELTTGIAGINNVNLSRSLTNILTSNERFYISISGDTTGTKAMFDTGYNYYYNNMITCPNNAVMYVTNISLDMTSNSQGIALLKFDSIIGTSSVIWQMSFPGVTYNICAGGDGSLGGYMYPGEAVAMCTTNLANTITAYANVVIKYLF
jgi:hypothetical protein